MERVYLDEPTSEMLYAKDPNPVTCMEKGFGFDETGKFHLLYYNEKGKVLRDFVIPSDPEPSPTQKVVADQMLDRLTRERKSVRLKYIAFAMLAFCITFMAISVFYMLTHI